MEKDIKQAIILRLNSLGEPIEAHDIAWDLAHEYNYGVLTKKARKILNSDWYKNLDKKNPKKEL